MRETTKAKYDAFCREYLSNNNNGSKAAEAVGYSKKSSRQMAIKLLQMPYIVDKMAQLQAVITEKSIEKFTVSVEQRLEWLQQAITYGFREIPVSAMDERTDAPTKAENLSASISGIKELNAMLGVRDTGDGATLADAINNLASSLPS